MDPEDDFLTWSVVLSTSFESGEYTTLLPSFTALITDILSTSKLHGILEEHTDYFLSNVLPDTVRSVLNLNHLSTFDQDTCTTFLVSVLPLIPWATIHDNFTLTQILLPILDIKSNMYSKNQTYNSCVPYEEVAKNYLSSDINQSLINFIKENSLIKNDENDQIHNEDNDANINEKEDKSQNTAEEQSNENTKSSNNNNKLMIQHFDVLFYSYCLIEDSDIINIDDISCIVEVTPYFIDYVNTFQTDDRLRELDTTLLNRSFQSLMTVLITYPTQPTKANLFQPIFQIACRFVESEMLEKQLIGASALSKAAESKKGKVINAFQEFINTSTLADFLIDRDIHAKLLEALDPVLNKIITPKHLESFWQKAEQVHSIERSTILSIIASSLKKFDEKVTLNFIDRITSAEKISPELLEFLANVAKSFTSLNTQLSLHIIDTLIDYGEKLPIDSDQNGAVNALATFAPTDIQCQKQIINVCSERIISNPSKQKYYIQLLKNMVSQTYQNKNDFNEDFLSVLINAISNPDFEKYQNRPDFYELLSALVTKKKYSIDINMFNTLTSFRVDDLLWKFLTEIITKLGTDAYDSKVKEKVYLTAKNINFRNNSSLVFVQFLQQFILIWNLKNGHVKSEYYNNYYYYYENKTIPAQYTISIFPMEKIGLMFKVIFYSRDDKVAEEAQSKILLFISKTKEITTKKVIDILIRYFDKASNLNVHKNKKHSSENENENKNSLVIDPLKIATKPIIIGDESKEDQEENKEELDQNKDKQEQNKEDQEQNKEELDQNKDKQEQNKEDHEENKEELDQNKDKQEQNKEDHEENKEELDQIKDKQKESKEVQEQNKVESNENNTNEESLDKNEEKDSVKQIDAQTECDEYIAKSRVLKLILQYIDEDEKNSFLDDYGVSRHKERSEILKKRHSSYDEIKLNIVYNTRNFQITAYRYSTPEDLKKRISRVLETSNFMLYHDNFSIISYTTLYQASIKDGSTIHCRQCQSYEQAGQKMPTMILYEKDFSKTMLDILSHNEPINKTDECYKTLEDLHKIVFTILKRLPSDSEIVKELDNIDLFIKNLSDSKSNTCLFLYRAQILLTNIEKKSDLSSLFVEHGGVKLLVEYLINHEPPFHGLTLILNILVKIFSRESLSSLKVDDTKFDIKEYDEKLIVYILNLFSIFDKSPEIKKSLPVAIKTLNDFLSNDSQRCSEIIFRYPQLLSKMIDNVQTNDHYTYVPFNQFTYLLSDKVQLFHLCVSKLNKKISEDSIDNNYSIDKSIINIIQNTIPYVHNLEDIKIVFDNCWRIMLKYEKTSNIINRNSPSDQVLPVPVGYEEEIEVNNKDKGLVYETRSDGNQTDQLSAVCQIIYSILIQETKLKEEEMKNTSHILDVLKLAVSTDVDEVQDNLFRLFSLLMPSIDDKEQYDTIIQGFRNAIDEIHTDRWNYKPSTFAKSPTGFTGLRNLGSTCYMNSIFQQLFFTFPFTYLIILSDMKTPPPPPPNQTKPNNKITQNEGHQKLKELFTQLLLTKRRSCDTQPFCSSWKGWGKRLINPREQQDANEFLQLLLDQLPSQLNTPFKGEIKNIIEGVSESFESFNIEQFYTICLEIKSYKNVEESFEFFIKSEPLKGESQYCISQDHKIDAMKYERIKTAPDILVLQLKRFEYNLTNFERIKINDRYEFPEKLNISRFMAQDNESNNITNTPSSSRDVNNNSSSIDDINAPSISSSVNNNNNKYDYELTGVVVHSGNAEGGHYYSIIKINQKWIKFNDIEVTEITQEEFENETFGGQQTNKTTSVYNDDFEDSTGASAYLLFYRRINAVYEVDLPVYLFDQCKSKDVEKVETVQKDEKVETIQKDEKVETVQKDEKVETIQKEEKVETEQKEEKVETEQKEEKVETVQKDEKAETEQKEEKVETEQKEVKAETEQKDEAEQKETSNKDDTVHVKLSYDRAFDLTYLCDRQLVKLAEEDNTEIVKLQAMFGLPMFNFMINPHEINDLECLISYFFNIYCHSSFNAQVTSMQFRLSNFVHTKEDWEFCIEYIKKNFKKLIEPIYINCSITEIMECTSQFIISVIANVDPMLSFPFVEELMPTLVYVLNASWRQVPHVSELMKSFVIQSEQHARIALENNWMNKFLDFITLVYDPTQPNELVSLLSPSVTPTSSSSLSYSTGNGSSSNLVQQITRSNVILQNINLSNVFLILESLFDVNPVNDYQKIIKYGNSILQSPSNSTFYINLLKKMSEKNIIDINVFINAITTNKKEIDNDLVFDTILNVLLGTDDPDRVETLINKVCPHVNATLAPSSSSNTIYGANASTSLTTAFTKRILGLVKKKNQEVINFLLKFPQQTIIRFLIDNDKYARGYGEKIVMNIFDKVSKVSDKDRERIINDNNIKYFGSKDIPMIHMKSNTTTTTIYANDDSSDDNDTQFTTIINETHKKKRKDELSEQDAEAMIQLYYAIISFIFDLGESDISQYYEKEENYMNQDSYHFSFFLSVFEWLIVRLNMYTDASLYEAIQMLYSHFASMKNKVDHNMMNTLKIISLLSVEYQQSVFKDTYEALFSRWNNIQNYEIVQMFNLFSNYLTIHCRPQDAMIIFKHPTIRNIQKELRTASSENDFIAFNTYNSIIEKFIDNNDPIENESFTLKQVIFMNTKFLFSGEFSNMNGLWSSQYTKLICLVIKYMTLSTRKKLVKEIAKTLNLKRYQYANYGCTYESDNSKKFIEACILFDFILNHKECLKHEIVPIQKVKFYDEITSKIELSENDYHSSFDRSNNDDDDPYDDEENVNKNHNHRNNNVGMNPIYTTTATYINEALNYNEENEFDDVQRSNGTFYKIQVYVDENEQIIYEKMFIKWERYVHNYLSLTEEDQLFLSARIFSLISKSELKEQLGKILTLQEQTQSIKEQISNYQQEKLKQKQQQQQNKPGIETDSDSDSDDDDYYTVPQFHYNSIENQLQNQLRSKERELDELNDSSFSEKMYEELHKLYKQSPSSNHSAKAALLMTDLVFNIFNFKRVNRQIANRPPIDNERAIFLVKLSNNFCGNSNDALFLLFYQTLHFHYMDAQLRNNIQRNNDEIDLSLNEIDDWSVYFVQNTISSFHYNKFSSLLYSNVLSKLNDDIVINLFRKFCENKRFYDVVSLGVYPHGPPGFDDSSDDDNYFGYNSKDIRPNEEEFNLALIFFHSKPFLRRTFLRIFPLKFRQITNQNYYKEKDYVKELYGNDLIESGGNVSSDDSDNERPSNINPFLSHQQNINNNDNDDHQVTKGTIENSTSSEYEVAPSYSKDDESTPSNSKDDIFSPSNSKDEDSTSIDSKDVIISPINSKDDESAPGISRDDIFSPSNSKDEDSTPINSKDDIISPIDSKDDESAPSISKDDIFTSSNSKDDL